MIARKVTMEGSGKSAEEWFKVDQANVSYDHPYHVYREHSLNIDFVNESQGPAARVAVELSVQSARNLVDTIQKVLQEAESGGWIDESEGPEVHMPPVRSTGS